MCEIWMKSKTAFVGDYRMDEGDLVEFERMSAAAVDEGAEAWIGSSARCIPGQIGVRVARIRGRPSDVALLHLDKHGDWLVGGGYVDETLWIDRGLRGRGLGAELVLFKAELLGGIVEPECYTAAGKRAHEAAHDLAVDRALADGHRVPEHIVAARRGRIWLREMEKA